MQPKWFIRCVILRINQSSLNGTYKILILIKISEKILVWKVINDSLKLQNVFYIDTTCSTFITSIIRHPLKDLHVVQAFAIAAICLSRNKIENVASLG